MNKTAQPAKRFTQKEKNKRYPATNVRYRFSFAYRSAARRADSSGGISPGGLPRAYALRSKKMLLPVTLSGMPCQITGPSA